MNELKIIAMIPARLGSQRIPKKNIRIMVDKPLIDYPIDLCIQSKLFNEIWINTEDEKLGQYATTKGINFHKRPLELASNTATNRDFMYEFFKKHDCDYVVMVNPTSPLLKIDTMEKFVNVVHLNKYDTILSVISEKTETYLKDEPVNFDVSKKINSQFLEPVKKVAWAMTAWKKTSFINMEDNGINPIFGGSVYLFDIPKDESCDLDTEEDWNIAEGMLTALKNRMQPKYLDL